MASFGLRLYLSYVYAHGLTYGALATPITFLLFYYFVSMAIIIGAQFNNAMLEFYPPRPSKREQRKWQRYDPERDQPATGDHPALRHRRRSSSTAVSPSSSIRRSSCSPGRPVSPASATW